VADALELPSAQLAAGGPAAPAVPGPVPAAAPAAGPPGQRAAAADALRVILAGAHSLRAALSAPAAPSAGWLRARTDRACGLVRAGRYDDLAELLAGLLPGLEAAVRAVPATEQSDRYELLAMAYQACAGALARLGDTDAAWVAADRAMAAAERAGHLLLVSAGAHRLASVFLAARRGALADELARTTTEALAGLASRGDPDATALCGGLALLRASVAAGSGRGQDADDQLGRARRLAARLGAPPAGGPPEFGPELVALYEIAVSVELGDAGRALRVAATLDPAAMSPARRVRMLVNVARAHALRGHLNAGIQALARAETAGLDYLRDSDPAREAIARLLELRAPPPAALAALAARLAAPAPDA
jgi:hypothetical protein